jgi:hypothetical protein
MVSCGFRLYRPIYYRSIAGIEVANPILNVESVRSIFIPALSEQGSESLSNIITIKGTQWSTAIALTTEDRPGRRKKGSAFCTQLMTSYLPRFILLIFTGGGWAGTSDFMDPATGIAAVFGVQVVPRPLYDAESYGLWDQLERLTYSGLHMD